MATKIYGFVADTAFYNRDFTTPGTISTVDQGACCATDKIASMFGTVGIIKDLRDKRTPLVQISDASEWTIDPLMELKEGNHTLGGTMSIMFDASKVTQEVMDLFSSERNVPRVQNFFHILEMLGYMEKFGNHDVRTTIPAHESDVDTVVPVTESEAYAALNPSSDPIVITTFPELEIDVFRTVNNVYTDSGAKHTRDVRRYVVCTLRLKDERNSNVDIEMHLWWDRNYFLGIKDLPTDLPPPSYPLSVITDVILPCPADKLYTLLSTYTSVPLFAESASEGKNRIYHITEYFYENGSLVETRGTYNEAGTLNEMVKSDDHTGVYVFTTSYYGHPDTHPNNSFNLGFNVVYKGAQPSLDDIKAALRAAILQIDPNIPDDEWRKKLPGIISDRWFFMIPLYDNVWKKYGGNVYRRYGIVDTTPNRIMNLISAILGPDYASQTQFAQLVIPKYSKYPVVVVPKMDNPANSKMISSIYKDYIGINASSEDDSDHLTDESTVTQDFTALFNAALAKATDDNLAHGSVTGFNCTFEMFTSTDGVTHCIVSHDSYKAVIDPTADW